MDTGTASALKERLIQILIKDDRTFYALLTRLQGAFTRAFSLGHQAAVARAMERLEAMGPERFSRAAEREILAAFEREVGPQAMARLLDGPVTVLGEALWRKGGAEGAGEAGVDYRFDLVDQEALALARRGDLYWVANHWDAYTRGLLSDAVARYFEQGQTYEQLAQAMREAMAGVHEAGMRYWELVADTMATKTREMGRIAGYQQAGIRYVQVKARMDERTTPLCRSLHGRLIRLDSVVAQRDKYLSAAAKGHLEAAKAAWPMWDPTTVFKSASCCEAHALAKAELPANVGLPPYHFRCRTITVAWLGEDPQDVQDPIERARLATLNREPARREDVEKLIERAMQARWDAGNLARHMKHAHAGIADYNQAAMDLIRRGGRDVALAMAQGQLLGLFFEPYKGDRVRVAVVNLERGRIVTLHIRRGIENERIYDVQPIVQPKARGIMRWWR